MLRHARVRSASYGTRNLHRLLTAVFVLWFFLPIIGSPTMLCASEEYVIHITVINATDEFQQIFLFQQEDELGLMFDKVFPVVWQIFPLPGKEEGVERQGVASYPMSQSIGVTWSIEAGMAALKRKASLLTAMPSRHLHRADLWSGFSALLAAGLFKSSGSLHEATRTRHSDDAAYADGLLRLAALLNGKLVIRAQAVRGDAFDYSFDDEGGQHLAKRSEKNQNGSITCDNRSEALIHVDFYKDRSRCAVWPNLAYGDRARFLLKRKLCFAYGDEVRQGATIREKIEGERVLSVDLAGCSRIVATLSYDPETAGKKKKWVLVKH